jgi:hypothetical protein
MSWYRDADNSNELNYSPPQVAEQKLDAGGNYVSPASEAAAGSGGAIGVAPQGNTSKFID